MADQQVRERRPNAESRDGSGPRGKERSGKARSGPVTNAADAARRASRSLARLIGHPVEGSSEVSRGEDRHWRVCVDVVEVRRIPDTTSLMATYEVDLDADGRLQSYRRMRRYVRGSADS